VTDTVELVVKPESVDEVLEHVDVVRQRILEGIRGGMKQAMEDLAYNVADKLFGNPIVSRSGELATAILESPKVTETPEVIRGTVTADVGRKHLGIWLEEGTHVPAVDGKLYEFTEPDSGSFYTHGHVAFQVKAHPFMNPSLKEYQTTIMQIIADSVAEATAE
jgi:hypothetical protein